MADPVVGESTTLHVPAVRGDGVNLGIVGTAQDGWAVSGESKKQVGVRGICEGGWGVSGDSKSGVGVRGTCENYIGVAGESKNGTGVYGRGGKLAGHFEGNVEITGNLAVKGFAIGVHGSIVSPGSPVAVGVQGEGGPGLDMPGPGGVQIPASIAIGVQGISSDSHGRGVEGINEAGIGIRGRGGRLAGQFQGDVEVTGDIRLVNADCAEDFDVSSADKVEPGTVMVLGNEGALFESQQAYDKRVAGVISGAGDYKPGIVLDKRQSQGNRQPVALLGKVFCKVDAQFGTIEVGDLLTTSSTPGHAMRADDPMKAFGAVIGKALRPLKEGQGLIPILIGLQ
jgi:hypothetical protein